MLSHFQNLGSKLPHLLDCGGVIFSTNGEPKML